MLGAGELPPPSRFRKCTQVVSLYRIITSAAMIKILEEAEST